MRDIILFLCLAIAIKSIIGLSGFNFWLWFKYGREYVHWFDKHTTETFQPKGANEKEEEIQEG